MTTTKDRFNGADMMTARGSEAEIIALRADLTRRGFRDVTEDGMVRNAFGRTVHYFLQVIA